ncbi:MAG TPA: bifunctional 4-hydroxy-2-oxoglutarate aldolase/2-dehydro-3-deoxy-phosphogluconate aldolase [Candidatus Dormibacteraeota bacterium]|nr:bifunctional 4-hydroxy-2-oxoglutarate aldolase/2-dehydro-3-deoxy-phosphogluconate aldolase [Candidatus Dormibacteraeota bacterium]
MTASGPQGIVAVLRGDDPGRVEQAARVLAESGVRYIEITCTVPDVMKVIEHLAGLESAVVGCGTVISVVQARSALNAGARFLVSPACIPELVATGKKADVPCILGALSPTEVLRAWEAGATQVKLFPVGRVGGPAYLRDLAGPYPTMRFMASGGIGLDDVSSYVLPNVASVALGGELAPASAIAAGDRDELKRRAARALLGWVPGK